MSLGPYLHPLQPYCQISSLRRVICWLQTPVFSLNRLRLHRNQARFISQCFELLSWWPKFLSETGATLLFAKISNIDKRFLLKEKLFFLRIMLSLTLVALPFLNNRWSHLLFTLADVKSLWTHLLNHVLSCIPQALLGMCFMGHVKVSSEVICCF